MLPLLTKIAYLKDVPGALPMLSRWRVPYRQHDRFGSTARLLTMTARRTVHLKLRK